MILVENGNCDCVRLPALKGMFRARKEVFVDLLKWDVPVVDGKYEVDAFDNERAIYLVVADDGGEHLASARLLETTGPHILGTLFPHLCTGPIPSNVGTLEITRFCLDRRLGARTRRDARNKLISALVGFALASGVSIYTGVAEIAWLQQILAFGWDCRPLGPPQQLNCGWLGALAISIDERTPAALDANGIWSVSEGLDFELARAA